MKNILDYIEENDDLKRKIMFEDYNKDEINPKNNDYSIKEVYETFNELLKKF